MNRKETTPPDLPERIRSLASVLSLTSAALMTWLSVRPRMRGLNANLLGYGLKILAGAFAPILGLMGLIGGILGRVGGRSWAARLGPVGALLAARFIRRVSASQGDFAEAFGEDWEPRLAHDVPASRLARMLRWRWQWGQVPFPPTPAVTRDLAFATAPDGRALLCDLWEPSPSVRRSGIAVIYYHGGAWQSFDKDVATRPFFRHLTSQGHVVMDVAYRLARETDMAGMVGDVKRALAWMKRHGASYGVDPASTVLAGGSAGGHLAMLAAYTPNHPAFDPADVRGVDTSVRGVISYYGVPDLRTLEHHWSQQAMHPLATTLGRALGFFPREGYLPWSKLVPQLFGGSLSEVQDELLRFSPVAHTGHHCPPTLLLQGLHDHITPVDDVRALHQALRAAGRPVVLVELPQVEHAFDMVALRISPPAQVALYNVERFLALLAPDGASLPS